MPAARLILALTEVNVMENNQKINCNVENCRHNGGTGYCMLDAITVVNTGAAPTAHFCGDYENDVF